MSSVRITGAKLAYWTLVQIFCTTFFVCFLVAHLTALNKSVILRKQLSRLWPRAAISVFEPFHVMNMGLQLHQPQPAQLLARPKVATLRKRGKQTRAKQKDQKHFSSSDHHLLSQHTQGLSYITKTQFERKWFTCLRRRWKYWAGVVGCATWRLTLSPSTPSSRLSHIYRHNSHTQPVNAVQV